MNSSHIAKALKLVTYVTASQYDADEEQSERFRKERPSRLEAYRDGELSEQDVISWINDVMGPDWKPSGEYGAFLEGLS